MKTCEEDAELPAGMHDWINDDLEWSEGLMKYPWKIGMDGRQWSAEEVAERHGMLPEPTRIEAVGGKLFWNDEERVLVLRMLLENIGLLGAVRVVGVDAWREAIQMVEKE